MMMVIIHRRTPLCWELTSINSDCPKNPAECIPQMPGFLVFVNSSISSFF